MEGSDNIFSKIDAASFYIPKDKPNQPLGEDAHFICAKAHTIGLADGVGGWSHRGIDGGEYARQLMSNSVIAVESKLRNGNVINPMSILQEAYNTTAVEGSSTACIITLSGDKLRAANIGDSGFLVIRDGKVAYKSPKQQHKFNCPYQLKNGRDDPTMAEEIKVSVRPGDLIVAGTDGLFDNVHDREIVKVLGRSMSKGRGLTDHAQCMATVALHNSVDKHANTPYSVESRKCGKRRRGGKVDDITVIVAQILID